MLILQGKMIVYFRRNVYVFCYPFNIYGDLGIRLLSCFAETRLTRTRTDGALLSV